LSAHPRALAFDQAVDVYEEARPEYPDEAVRWLAQHVGLGPGGTVLDLAAGTGKLTRRLVGTGARVLAVEPLPGMRARLEKLVPEAEALDGTAEQIPVEDGSVDLITVGQAIHWFRLDEALREIHRVLRPAGTLALLSNRRAAGPVDDAVSGVLGPLRGDTPGRENTRWREAVGESGLFGPLEQHEFAWDEEMDTERVVKRALSISFVAAMTPVQQEEVAARIRDALAALARPLVVPHRTEVFISLRQTGTP
jgi:SAM-dependent methyltransferase